MFNYCGNFSVRTKVAVVMAGVLLVAAALGLFAVRELWSVNANAAEIRTDWLPSTRILGELNYAVTRYRSAQGTTLMLEPGPLQEKQVGRVAMYTQKIDDAMARYMPLVSSDEERAAAAQVQEALAAYRPLYGHAIELARAGNRQEAAKYYIGTMRDHFDILNKAITDDIALNDKGGIAAADRSEKTFEQAQMWIYIAIGLTVLLCVAATWALTTFV